MCDSGNACIHAGMTVKSTCPTVAGGYRLMTSCVAGADQRARATAEDRGRSEEVGESGTMRHGPNSGSWVSGPDVRTNSPVCQQKRGGAGGITAPRPRNAGTVSWASECCRVGNCGYCREQAALMASSTPDVPISVGLRVLDQLLRGCPTAGTAAKSAMRGTASSAYGSKAAARRARYGGARMCPRPETPRGWSLSRR